MFVETKNTKKKNISTQQIQMVMETKRSLSFLNGIRITDARTSDF